MDSVYGQSAIFNAAACVRQAVRARRRPRRCLKTLRPSLRAMTPGAFSSQSQGGGLCTHRPPTIVATTSTVSSSSGGQSSGSRESTTRSARNPGTSLPRRRSSPASQAGLTVAARSASSIVSACSGCHAGRSSIFRSTPARSPASGSSSSTGASEPFARSAPESSSERKA